MKTNYINQFKRDIMRDCDHSDCTPIVEYEHLEQPKILRDFIKAYRDEFKDINLDYLDFVADRVIAKQKNNTPIVEDVSMEVAARRYAESFRYIDDSQLTWVESKEKPFKAGWQQREQQLLPIIKELLEVIIKANLYVPPKFYGQGESYENEDHITIQTILKKYENYL